MSPDLRKNREKFEDETIDIVFVAVTVIDPPIGTLDPSTVYHLSKNNKVDS